MNENLREGGTEEVPDNQTSLANTEYVHVEAPWEVLASSIIGNYQNNQMTVSDSGVMNATQGRGDTWRRVNTMPRFKKKGTRKRKFKLARLNDSENDEGVVKGNRKRKASSDPGQNKNVVSDTDSAQSTSCSLRLNTYKRFCNEGRIWLDRINARVAGEGTSRQGENRKGKTSFMVEYADDNILGEESIVDSESESPQEDEEGTKEDDNNKEKHNGVAGVDHEQSPTTP